MTNYTYVLNNDSISNQTYNHSIKKHFSFNFKDFIVLLIDFLMIIGPSLGYFLQSLKFKKTKSSKGFSKSLCLIIYFSQILRVFFWIGKPFRITLLYQSILIIIFQIYLIHLWVKYHGTQETVKNEKQGNDFNFYENKEIIEYLIDWSDTISPNKIWNWSNEIEYFKFMALIVFILLVICGVLGIHNSFLTNIIGTISVTSEASTLIPQIIVSCKTKNSGNLATSMVALWAIGDTCKFIYNIIYKTPIQMIISGGLQIFLDFFSLMQIICYRGNKKINKNEVTSVEITSNIKGQKLQEINQFMNKIERRFNSEYLQNSNEEKNKDNNNQNNNNKIEVNDGAENSDKIEVLDKSRDDRVKYNSDDEDQNNNIPHHELHEEETIDNNNEIKDNEKQD
jgi:uncharacterized protein with PQ loop repeat